MATTSQLAPSPPPSPSLSLMSKAKTSSSIVRRLTSLANDLSSSAVELKVATMHSFASSKLAIISDVEGHWDKIARFIELNSILALGPEDENGDPNPIIMGENNMVAFLGDAMDKGPNNIKVLKFLLALKKKYPERVVLLLGNRDINKLRLNWELSDAALALNTGANNFSESKFRIFEWSALFEKFVDNKDECKIDGVFTKYAHGKSPSTDRILKLKFLLKYTMGSPNAFEDVKKELGGVKDAEVCDFYRKLVAPGGMLTTYLQLGQLAYIHEPTSSILVHGGISKESLGLVPGQSASHYEASPNASISLNLRMWVQDLNSWAQNQISAGIKGNMKEAMDIIRYQEPRIVPDEAGRATWKGSLPNPISVIQGRPWSEEYNLQPIDSFTKLQLARNGINKIVFGHSPVGQVPVIMKDLFPNIATKALDSIIPVGIQTAFSMENTGDFLTVACDTSVTEPNSRIASVEISRYGVRVNALFFESGEGLRPIICNSWDRNCGVSTTVADKGESIEIPAWKLGTVMGPSGPRVLTAAFKQANFGGNKLSFGIPSYSWIEQ